MIRHTSPLALSLLLACPACGATSDLSEGDAGTTLDEAGSVAQPGAADPPDASPPPQDRDQRLGSFDRRRYFNDLRFIAQPRPPGSSHWQAVQDVCAERLIELGYDVERADYGSGVNVLGTQIGLTRPSEQVVVGAHYDHIDNCTGADDNGTGVAGTLELARMLAGVAHDRTLVVACWDEEERGLIGSTEHVRALTDLSIEVTLGISLEMIGYRSDEPNSQDIPPGFGLAFPDEVAAVQAGDNRGDFIALIGDTAAGATMDAFSRAAEPLGLPTIRLEASAELGPLIATLVRSDQASFWLAGEPGLMITDTANFRNRNYHCAEGDDSVGRLDHDFAGLVIDATGAAVLSALND